jgi:hypothetical protein
MKKIFYAIPFLLFIFSSNFLVAQTLNIPPASPLQTVNQQFATSNIEISYSRPSVNNREVFGEVVPFDAVWRTGANRATTIFFGEDVTVNGTKLTKGKYGLLTIPSKSEWTIILSKDTTVTSANAYKQENDAVRISAKPTTLLSNVETFTIAVENIKTDEAQIVLSWDKTAVSFTVKADIDTKIMAQIEEVMSKDTRPYYQAAAYYFNNDKDFDKALLWVNKAIESRPDAFWMTHMKAKILLKQMKFNEAIIAAEVSKKQAEAADYAEYVKMNDKLIAEIKSQPGFKPAKK